MKKFTRKARSNKLHIKAYVKAHENFSSFNRGKVLRNTVDTSFYVRLSDTAVFTSLARISVSHKYMNLTALTANRYSQEGRQSSKTISSCERLLGSGGG